MLTFLAGVVATVLAVRYWYLPRQRRIAKEREDHFWSTYKMPTEDQQRVIDARRAADRESASHE